MGKSALASPYVADLISGQANIASIGLSADTELRLSPIFNGTVQMFEWYRCKVFYHDVIALSAVQSSVDAWCARFVKCRQWATLT